MKTMHRDHLTADVVDYVIATATRAPSVHNSQPWRFRYVDGVIEVRADPERGLRIADPAARELVISCGGAIRTLELAIRGLGLHPGTRLLPEPNDPRLLARVEGLPGAPPDRSERLLLAAITRRHTHRGAFSATPPSEDLLRYLWLAARKY